jgi:hypothetical protein
MYCPECGVEYRAGFTECSDCHVGLVEQPPPPAEVPSPNLELVRVLEGNNQIVEAVAKMVLEEAGIPFYMEGEEGRRSGLSGWSRLSGMSTTTLLSVEEYLHIPHSADCEYRDG